MAEREELILDIAVDSAAAKADVQQLDSEIKGLEGGPPIEIGVDTSTAVSQVESLKAEIAELSAVEARLTLDMSAAQASVAKLEGDLVELRTEFDFPKLEIIVEADLNNARSNVDALDAALEDVRLSGQEAAAAIDRIETERLRSVGGAAEDAGTKVRGLGRASEQSRSVLGNLTGNAVQDLGALGGVAGTTGVALGQLAEYAVQGDIRLRNLAKVAGPMLGVAAAATVIGQAIGAINAEKAFKAELVEDFTAALREGETAMSVLRDTIAETGELNFETGIFGGGGLLGLTSQTQDLIPLFNTLGISYSEFIELLNDPSGSDWLREQKDLLLELSLAAQDDATADVYQRQAEAARDAATGLDAYRESVGAANVSQADLDKFMGESIETLETLNTALTELQDPLTVMPDLWSALINDAKDGAFNFENAAAAVDLLAEATGLSTDAIIARVNVQAGKELKAEAEATKEAAEAQREYADQIFGTEGIRDAQRSANEANAAALAEETAATKEAIDVQREYADQIFGTEGIRNAQRSANEANAKALEAETAAAKEAIDVQRGYADQIFGTNAIRDAQRSANEANAAALEEEAAAAEEAAEAQRELAESLADVVDDMDAVALRADAVGNAFGRLNVGSELSQFGEMAELSSGLDTVHESLHTLNEEGVDWQNIDLIPDTWEEVLAMPEELQPVVQAFAGLRDTIQADLSRVFESGGPEALRVEAQNAATAVVDMLRLAGITSQTTINEILSALGLLPEQVEVTIALAGQEQARAILESFDSILAGLPPEVQIEIQTLAATDPVAALQLTIDKLKAAGIPVPLELELMADQLSSQVAGLPPQTIEVGANTEKAVGDINALTDAEHPTTIEADAETARAASDLLDTADEPRTALIVAHARVAGASIDLEALANKSRTAKIVADAITTAASGELAALASRSRIAKIGADAITGSAESELNRVARNRTSTIFVRTVGGATSGGGAFGAYATAPTPGAQPMGARGFGAVAPRGLDVPLGAASGGGGGVIVINDERPNLTVNMRGVIGNTFEMRRNVAKGQAEYTRVHGTRGR